MSTFNSSRLSPCETPRATAHPGASTPYWAQEHYPDTNTDEVQFGGLGNPSCYRGGAGRRRRRRGQPAGARQRHRLHPGRLPQPARPSPTCGSVTASSSAAHGPRSGAEHWFSSMRLRNGPCRSGRPAQSPFHGDCLDRQTGASTASRARSPTPSGRRLRCARSRSKNAPPGSPSASASKSAWDTTA